MVYSQRRQEELRANSSEGLSHFVDSLTDYVPVVGFFKYLFYGAERDRKRGASLFEQCTKQLSHIFLGLAFTVTSVMTYGAHEESGSYNPLLLGPLSKQRETLQETELVLERREKKKLEKKFEDAMDTDGDGEVSLGEKIDAWEEMKIPLKPYFPLPSEGKMKEFIKKRSGSF